MEMRYDKKISERIHALYFDQIIHGERIIIQTAYISDSQESYNYARIKHDKLVEKEYINAAIINRY